MWRTFQQKEDDQNSITSFFPYLIFPLHLQDVHPDLTHLHSIASKFTTSCREAEKTFHEVFQLNPQSLAALRLFAEYNACINSREKSQSLSAEADRIEESKSREASNGQSGGQGKSWSFSLFQEAAPEVMADASSMLTLGASSRDLGMIQSANAATCRTFGYSRFQLERRNLSILLPPGPVTEIYMSVLSRYVTTGDSTVRITDTVRAIFGRNKHGEPCFTLHS